MLMELLLLKYLQKSFLLYFKNCPDFISLSQIVNILILFLKYLICFIKCTFTTKFLLVIYVRHIHVTSKYLLNLFIWLVVNCSDPGIPPNSKRESKIEHGNFTYGTVVFYDCNPGYFLFGSSVLICQPNGQWDKPLPECISKQIM